MIYLDHAATTPMLPRVAEAMAAYQDTKYGNPSSLHRWGREARAAVDQAREKIAQALGAESDEILFTSGGTEADNAAVIGTALAAREGKGGRRVLLSSVEHHAVLESGAFLRSLGFEVEFIPVDGYGQVRVAQLEQLLAKDTLLVSVMMANNEVGTLQPIEEIGKLLRERGIWFHTDAVQALGLVPMDLSRLPVDLLSFSAHKLGGPKGVGGLYIRHGTPFQALIRGGSQERRRRGGTENVGGIVGMAEAIQWAVGHREENLAHYRLLRQRMLEELVRHLGEAAVVVHGHPEQVLPHILNLSFPGVSTESLLMNLDLEGVAASSGSACTAGSLLPSHVLQAMGVEERLVRSAVRFSFGWTNTVQEVERAAAITAQIVQRLRKS